MGEKYEVTYYNYKIRRTVRSMGTNSFYKAYKEVCRLEKLGWKCVSIVFRR